MFKRLLNEEHKTTTITTIAAAVLCAGLGTLMHYVYEWSGKNLFVGLFAPVNESVWEHLKLLVIPLLFLMIFEFSIYGRKQRNFFTAKFLGTLVGKILPIGLRFLSSSIILQSKISPLKFKSISMLSSVTLVIIIAPYFSFLAAVTKKPFVLSYSVLTWLLSL